MFLLTEHGKKCVEDYIAELKAKRKEILDAGFLGMYGGEIDVKEVEE